MITDAKISVIEIDPKDSDWYEKAIVWQKTGSEVYLYETIESYDNSVVNVVRLKDHIKKMEFYFDK